MQHCQRCRDVKRYSDVRDAGMSRDTVMSEMQECQEIVMSEIQFCHRNSDVIDTVLSEIQ